MRQDPSDGCPEGIHVRLHGMTLELSEHLEHWRKMGLEHASLVFRQPAITVVVAVDAFPTNGHPDGFPIGIHGGLLMLGQLSC